MENNDDIPLEAVDEFHRGQVLFIERKFEEAVASFTKAIELGWWDAESYGMRGKSYCEQREFDLAIADLTKAIEIFNGDRDFIAEVDQTEMYRVRGIAHRENADYQSAMADFSKTIEIYESDDEGYFSDDVKASPYFSRGNLHKQLGNKKEAIADYEQAVKLNPDVERYVEALEEARGAS